MINRVAYILNQYPKVSHSFIRTEILALERLGITVDRIAMRGWTGDLVDPLDVVERGRTRYVLSTSPTAIIGAVLATMVRRPAAFTQALATAWRLGRGGERSGLFHLIYLAEACVALRWIEATRAEHVHAHFGSNATTVAMLVRALGGPPFSFTVHGPEEFDKPLQLKLREKIAAARAVIAITSFCRSQLYRWSALPDWPKIKIVHCTLDPRFDGELGPPLATASLICVGRLCEQKGQLLLVEAVSRLRDRGIKTSLILGGDGEMRNDIEHAIARLSLGDAVTITGWISADQVKQKLSASDIMVLPSFAEGLPIAIMEAMALGRPVVSTMIAGIPELVRSGQDGELVPPGDVAALTDAIARVLSISPAERAKAAASAAARVRSRHDADTEARKLATIFGS